MLWSAYWLTKFNSICWDKCVEKNSTSCFTYTHETETTHKHNEWSWDITRMSSNCRRGIYSENSIIFQRYTKVNDNFDQHLFNCQFNIYFKNISLIQNLLNASVSVFYFFFFSFFFLFFLLDIHTYFWPFVW